jgi:DNA-binding transcriptional ArsR family regulator
MNTTLDHDAVIAPLADLFHLLGDRTRLRIVLACLAVPISVSEIAANLQLSGSLVSHHLRLLRAARIVKSERHGKHVFYMAADAHISSVLRDLLEHIAEPAHESEP